MKKEEYTKPILESKPFAQFESVYAGCSKTPNKTGCKYSEIFDPGSGSGYNAHSNFGVS